MRKTIIIGLVALLSLILGYGFADALTGVCSNCHTMHYSQGGSGTDFGPDGPYRALLKSRQTGVNPCVGCHCETTASYTQADTGAPQVIYSSGLAGGKYVTGASNDGKQHNVDDYLLADSVLDSVENVAPGFKASVALFDSKTGPASWAQGQQVSCAGIYGCHGDREEADLIISIYGSHHESLRNNMSANNARTGYRFLYGIKGKEDTDWEHTVSATDHNGYYGEDNFGNNQTISYLCSECHGNFHANTDLGGETEVGTASPWLRHPTDINLQATSTASPFTADYNSYDTDTPVAFASPETNTDTFTTTNGIAMCLSCHRAHGTDNSDILRWTYDSSADSGGTTKCLRCHVHQR